MSECIQWWGPMRPLGYGRFNLRRRSGEYAHRRIWEECFGLIPDGMIVHHRCANRACVNPEHLALTTNAEHPDSASGIKQSAYCKNGHLLPPRNSRGVRECVPCRNERRRSRRNA